jgi:hypothetical protein
MAEVQGLRRQLHLIRLLIVDVLCTCRVVSADLESRVWGLNSEQHYGGIG